MRSFLTATVLALSACDANSSKDIWPDISFVIMDQIPDKEIFSRTHQISPTVERVLVLPIVENYYWEGKRHRLAIADPIFVKPGKVSMKEMFSPLETNGQAVRRAVLLARGYCPGSLQPVINYSGIYEGREAWLIDMAKITEAQSNLAKTVLTNELSHQAITVGPTLPFEDALSSEKLLSCRSILSPLAHPSVKIIRNGKLTASRNEIVLWSNRQGTVASVCLSNNGRKLLQMEL